MAISYVRFSSLLIIVGIFLFGCGGGGDDGGGGGTEPSIDTPSSAVTSIEFQTGDPKYTGFDLQFEEGDYWLYDWEDYSGHRNIITGVWESTTKVGTVRLTLGSSKTLLGIPFFQVSVVNTGEANYDFSWSYIASYNNKIYGVSGDYVYLIFDAYNGTWKGGTFFTYPDNDNILGPADTFEINSANFESSGMYSVSSSSSMAGYTLFTIDYFSPYIGPVEFEESIRSDSSRDTETLELIESSF